MTNNTKTNTTTTNRATCRAEQNSKDIKKINYDLFYIPCTIKAIKFLLAKQWSEALQDIIYSIGNDCKALNLSYFSDVEKECNDLLKQARKNFKKAEKTLTSLTSTADERADAQDIYNEEHYNILTLQSDRATATDKHNTELTLKNFIDCVQVFALVYERIEPTAKIYISAEQDFIKSISSHKYTCRCSIKQLKPFKHIKHIRTDIIKNNYFSKSAKLSTIAFKPLIIEHTARTFNAMNIVKNYARSQKAVVASQSNSISIEELKNEKGEITAKIVQNYNTYINSQGAKERLNMLFDVANLTPRERTFNNIFCTKKAIEEERKAFFEYMQQWRKDRTEKGAKSVPSYSEARKRAENKGYKARIEYTITAVTKLVKEESRKSFKKELFKKLRQAQKELDIKISKNDIKKLYILDDYDFYNIMVTTNRGTTQSTTDHAYILDWIDRAKPTAEPTSVINWLSETQAERVQADRKAEYIELFAKSEIDNSTPEKQHTAETNHARYILKQATNNNPFVNLATAEELQTACKQLEKHRAKAKAKAEQEKRRAEQRRRKAQQDRLNEYRQTAVYNFMYSKSMNNAELKEFKKLSLKQQYNKMCMINFINGFIACQHLNGSELEQFKKLSLKEQYRTAKANY